MRVEDIMTTDVITVEPGTTLKEVATRLIERGISGLPVVEGDEVVGVISEADLLVKERSGPRERGGLLGRLLDRPAAAEDLKLEARLAGEAMTAPAITVPAYWSVAGTAERMLTEGINRLPVVSQGRLVGIVTRADLVRAFARSDAEIERELQEQITLEQELAYDRNAVDVQVRDGETTLSGRVDRRSLAELLPRIVARVPGVVRVQSELTWGEDDR